MEWQNLIALLTVLGGWDALKYLLNRKTNKRLEEAQVDTAQSQADSADAQATADEFHALREYNEFLQQQLQQKEERFADQTDRLRKSQEREFELMKENTDLKLELATKRCERKRCGEREPQNGY
ncbi:MAG: hypothetical protein K2L28_04035 [Muribaculaceae bacterium]|nr:hypothetical protein [Muribaculaceae bacterium]